MTKNLGKKDCGQAKPMPYYGNIIHMCAKCEDCKEKPKDKE